MNFFIKITRILLYTLFLNLFRINNTRDNNIAQARIYKNALEIQTQRFDYLPSNSIHSPIFSYSPI